MPIKVYHKGCGGLIKNRQCSKCGKTWSRWKLLFAKDIIEVEEPRFDPKIYRDRIRKGKDLL